MFSVKISNGINIAKMVFHRTFDGLVKSHHAILFQRKVKTKEV